MTEDDRHQQWINKRIADAREEFSGCSFTSDRIVLKLAELPDLWHLDGLIDEECEEHLEVRLDELRSEGMSDAEIAKQPAEHCILSMISNYVENMEFGGHTANPANDYHKRMNYAIAVILLDKLDGGSFAENRCEEINQYLSQTFTLQDYIGYHEE